MMTTNQELIDQAAEWLAVIAGDDPDFDGFTAWLETSPDHVRAYDSIMLMDDAVDANRQAIQAAMPANDAGEHEQPHRRHFLATAAAVALILPVSLWFGMSGSKVELKSGTAPMQVALDARTLVDLDQNSVLRHAKNQTDQIELAQGAAHFSVTHDSSRSFTVKAGDVSIVDLGTKFEIQRNGAQVGVSVSEGSVAIALAGAKSVTLTAGEQAFVEHGLISRGRVGSGSIASWRRGQLVYQNAPLSQIVKEISRYTTVPVTVDPSLANRRFSGVLTIGDGHSLDNNLADFMGLALFEQGNSVRIGARPLS